ncbi:hypothetical protein MNBD_ALPHA03-1719 [hydrothermal vent metagenome]|uniref:VanZ-like domain-containing protein n=1 Tax=hydrothermal vent metagenome TaxID=652676 RepID=A0A3B1AJX0_9ZZZZ
MRKIFAFFIFIIIYGSLFPFTFSPHEGSSEQWDIFLRSYYPITSLGDILGNIALFIPFGYLGIECMRPSMRSRPAYLKILAAGILLAFILQLIQVYISSRSPAMADVYWNGVGIVIGFILLDFIKKYFPKLSITEAANTPVILSFFWLLYLFFPFIPTLDFQEIKNGLKPLLLSQSFHADDFLVAVSGWLLFAHFTRGFFHQKYLNRLILPLCAIMSLPLRLIILNNSLDLSDVMAVFAALLIWFSFLKNRVNIVRTLAYLLFVSIAVYSLSSMDFSPYGWHFSMIPFSGFLEGDLFSNTKALFFKLFLFGSTLWLVKVGWPYLRLKTVWLFLFIFMLEIIQIFMASRSAEITDPLIILLLAFVVKPKAENFSTIKKVPKKIPEKPIEIKPPDADPANNWPANNWKKTQKDLWRLLGSAAFITIVMSMAIKLPGVPYNIRELFKHDGSLTAIMPFVLFILWFGMSVPLISRRMQDIPGRHFIRFPLWVIAAGLVSFFLLESGVTEEALKDILGAPTIYRHIISHGIWGEPGRILTNYFPNPDLWNLIEYVIRFLALFSPVTFLLCLFYYSGDLIKKYEIRGIANKGRLIALSLTLNILYALPWLYLCKYIAFDQANTDNLVELISRQGFMGIGGGGYLYFLILLLTLNSVLIRQSLYHWTVKLLFTSAAATGGWYLLNLGLELNIEKYGTSFSAVDFLLGPDRQHKLNQSTLFIRWIILYIGCVITLVWGMKFNLLSLMTNIKQKFKQRFKPAGS